MNQFSEHRVAGASARLWLGDALSGLQEIEPGTVDLIITSPPYFVGKEYDQSQFLVDFQTEMRRIVPSAIEALKDGGSLCLQVGNHVHSGRIMPLDAIIAYELHKYCSLSLRNRIIWTFGHGAHASNRFSGRHETVLWYTKGHSYYFNLDSARIPQKYPGKRHYKGIKKGEWSGNPLGKNPGDVWDIGDLWEIPNVKANHVEKTQHPCQFPTALVRRLVLALSPNNGLVVDPYVGSGTTAVASLIEGRNTIGIDLEQKYLQIAKSRICDLEMGNLRIREDKPVQDPEIGRSVTQRPPHFRSVLELTNV